MHPPVMDEEEKTTSADKALNEQHVSPTGQLPSFPEGGLKAWSTVLGAYA